MDGQDTVPQVTPPAYPRCVPLANRKDTPEALAACSWAGPFHWSGHECSPGDDAGSC